jgi:drug/metabolite transporter (DMT)-like permease
MAFPNPPQPTAGFLFPAVRAGAKTHMSTPNQSKPSQTMVILAFGIIYVLWGSTYLAIRVVVETLPPFLSGGVRFLVAGSALLMLLWMRGVPLPSAVEWRNACVVGFLLLVGGNGLVMWAEKSISSGLTALLIALTPVWFALLDWARPNGTRPGWRMLAGIVVGFSGIVVLINGDARANGSLVAAIAIVVAGISWAGGSLYAKHTSNGGSAWMNAAMQMICGGGGLLLVGTILAEPWRTEWSGVSARSLLALGYLVVFGSWIAFSAYVWLLQVSTPSRVSTYAYVNPVIAVFLGWALLGETVSSRMFLGMLVVVAGVVIITIPQGPPRTAELCTSTGRRD